MNFCDLNDALQRATADGEWIYWRGDYADGRLVEDVAYLANSHASVRLGGESNGMALLYMLPDAESRLRAI